MENAEIQYLVKYYEELMKDIRLYSIIGFIMLFFIIGILLVIAFQPCWKDAK